MPNGRTVFCSVAVVCLFPFSFQVIQLLFSNDKLLLHWLVVKTSCRFWDKAVGSWCGPVECFNTHKISNERTYRQQVKMSAHNSPTRKIVFQTGARLEAMDFTHVW